MNNKEIGNLGENIAKDYLFKLGFKILETNFRYSKMAEIDIIAKKDDVVHFVEVKTRKNCSFGTPLEAINKKKLNSIYQCGMYYIKKSNIKYKQIQIDAIGIIIKENNEPEIQYLADIFI